MSSAEVIKANMFADYFIWKANKEGSSITNKKLQKILYYAQAWTLVFKNIPLFREDIEAWIHGPVIKTVYNEYKKFGFGDIKKNVDDSIAQKVNNLDVLDEVWRFYGRFDADYLETLTHNELPWLEARGDLNEATSCRNTISLETMKSYFKERYETAKSNS